MKEHSVSFRQFADSRLAAAKDKPFCHRLFELNVLVTATCVYLHTPWCVKHSCNVLLAGPQHTALQLPRLWGRDDQDPQQYNRHMHTPKVLPCCAACKLHHGSCCMWRQRMQHNHRTVHWRDRCAQRGAMHEGGHARCLCERAVQAGQRWHRVYVCTHTRCTLLCGSATRVRCVWVEALHVRLSSGELDWTPDKLSHCVQHLRMVACRLSVSRLPVQSTISRTLL
jgi:hypothetical protein